MTHHRPWGVGSMKLPSGRTFSGEDILVLDLMAKYGCITWSDTPFTLKYGGESNVYVHLREDVTLNPDLAKALTMKAWSYLESELKDEGRRLCFIGVPLAGAVLASWLTAASAFDPDKTKPSSMLAMRSVLKTHGANPTWIDGKPSPDARLVLVENVRTTGKSEDDAVKLIGADSIDTSGLIRFAYVDRMLSRDDSRLALYHLDDILFAFGNLGIWPRKRANRALEQLGHGPFADAC